MSPEAAGASTRAHQPAPTQSPGVPKSSVCILLPTLNEAATIGDIVSDFRARGYDNVLVMDGGSTDQTRDIAREAGARVVEQSGEGKGQAIREAMAYVEVAYVLMLDGDGTYDPADAERMLEPLAGGYEHVIGDRFADIDPDAMTRLNRVGNRLINRSFTTIHGAEYADILSGYRAFTVDSFERCSPSADGFTIETELAVECVKQGIDTTVVPISYGARPDDSETNLRPVRDGGRIIVSLYSLARTNNPLFFFGSLGLASIVVGATVALFVLTQWLVNDVGHNILALVGAAAILLGVQLLMFGVLSDMIVSLHRDQRRQLQRLSRVERTHSADRPAHGEHDRDDE
ncbi:family 2 glycosyl transferase [Halovivax asiaticus JCM 14624]|uniref:Family 2 glycosyl transferase n=1 Tax=Halovivax asiaticus JCM 14624 TaxID=1227490 RepID=M0BSE0_9EURY|nr:S-layer glycoprotein N-glycosyltransferase AglJ [Halovivax asiaticus]ELZ12599.1 family 2 glycosyl transferase [Halovivax asiaticus JCM 14624]